MHHLSYGVIHVNKVSLLEDGHSLSLVQYDRATVAITAVIIE